MPERRRPAWDPDVDLAPEVETPFAHLTAHPDYDQDIIAGEREWTSMCRCGHRRGDHWAETGSRGSFGGSACKRCWACGTFRDA